MKPQQKNVYNIPAGEAFARSLATELLRRAGDNPAALPNTTILLPTRRSARVLREAFLKLTDGKPLLLPRMQALGDIDEEELSLSVTGDVASALAELPPGITPLRRQLLLAKLIRARPDFEQGPDYALDLAGALGQLMDQIHNEGLDIANLAQLAPAEFAAHWQITIKFLEIISQSWPEILAQEGLIDPAARRSKLIETLASHWHSNPPPGPVIAAGSTGSIPGVAHLLAVIATMPQGEVVLPGLDKELDETSWAALGDSHPQYGLKAILQHMGVERHQVKPWPGLQNNPVSLARRIFAAEVMRPAETVDQWILLQNQKSKLQQIKEAFTGLKTYECSTEREESEIIAILMREILQHKNQTAALITPDQNLARRVAMICSRWGIIVDNSAGQGLDQTSLGGYLRLVLQACIARISPVSLLAALKHRLCHPFEALQSLEELALRGPRPAPGFPGLYARLEGKDNAGQAAVLLETLETAFSPAMALSKGKHPFAALLQAHIDLSSALAGPEAETRLWTGEAGEAAATLFATLEDEARLIPDCTMQEYAAMLERFMAAVTVRPAWGTHPRVMILGQLEARMIDADLVILGGLNEGTWPPEAGHDPWMSRLMRAQFGLPGYERRVGLAAHDFVQGFCAPNIALTRSDRANGAPTVPARWLQRLDTVLQAAGLSRDVLIDHQRLQWARKLDEQGDFKPVKRPAPCPPVAARPREIAATRIETWLKDPYGIYARYVLRLRKLDQLEEEPDARRRGDLLHAILQRFVNAHRKDLPKNAAAILNGFAQEEIAHFHDDPAAWSFWWPRFERLGNWYISHEQSWRSAAKPVQIETEGRLTLTGPGGDFIVKATADRIDSTAQGAAIIDYKSGGSFSAKGIVNGKSPQLAAEGLILSEGGFEGLSPQQISHLSYWIMTGGSTPGQVKGIEDTDVEQAISNARNGLLSLIAAFDDPKTPYYSLPRPANAPRFSDYEHLARVKEWSVLEDSGETAGEAA